MNPQPALTPVDYDPFLPSALEKVIPLTPEQLEIYVSSVQSDDASAAYNLAVSYRFNATPDWPKLEQCINILVANNEVLRGSLGTNDTVLCIAKSLTVPLPVASISHTDTTDTLKHIIQTEAITPFDLSQGPLIRCQGVELEGSAILIITFHHIIVDGWSIDLLSDELARLYNNDTETQADNRTPFSSYYIQQAQQKEQAAYQVTLDFWLKRFSNGVPVLDLPLSPGKTRPAFRTYHASRYVHTLKDSVSQTLVEHTKKTGKTLFSVNYAIYLIFLHKLTSQTDIVVGVPSARQPANGTPNLVGQCVSMLPLRHTIDANQPFDVFVEQVANELFDAQDHNELSFGDLLSRLSLARDPSRVPMISTVFNIDTGRVDRQFGDMNVSVSHNPRAFETFELTVLLAKNDETLSLECHYNTNLFDEATIVSWLQQYECLLTSALSEPKQALSALNRLSDEDKTRLAAWNQTRQPVSATSLHQMIESTVADQAKQRAVVFNEVSYSYEVLNQRANQLANYLVDQGVQPNQMIGICVERSAEMLVVILGILKSGAAYLPLDPLYPPDRIAYILSNAQAPWLITQASLTPQIPDHKGETLLIDTDWHRVEKAADTSPSVSLTSDDLAYVIYTSGSTGNPKGVQITHGNVVNFLSTMADKPGFTDADKLLAVTTLSFDIHVLELYLPLTTGGEVHVASRELTLDGHALADYIDSQDISVMQATPATWRLMLQSGWTGSPELKALIGGEALPADLLAPLLANVNQLWNMYGPTETTVWSTCCQITDSSASISIGQAIGNTTLYVVDEFGQQTPIGIPGELCIGGLGVTKGYLHLPDMTQDKFVNNPFANDGSRMYRTGDLVSFREDGHLYYHHRLDNQVKVRGFRIELGEIESVISDYPGVTQVVVIVREDTPGDARLVAYVVPEAQTNLDLDTLKEHAKQHLPHYMMPSHTVVLSALPQTPNGKIDRKALPKPLVHTSDKKLDASAPKTEAETFIFSAWSELVGTSDIYLDDNFFEIGGHSLLAVQFITKVLQEYDVKINFQAIVLDNLGQLARTIERESPKLEQESTRAAESNIDLDTLAVPFYFDNQRLYGTYYPPKWQVSGVKQSLLICGPISYEYQCTHRILNLLAEKLAKSGVAVLRFDYWGTGDSLGEDFQADLSIWKENIIKAHEELRQRSGIDKPAVLGVRLGANLAYSLKDSLPASQWLLWQPVSHGRRHVSLLHKMHMSLLKDAGRFKQVKKWQANPKGKEYLGFVYNDMLIDQFNHLQLPTQSDDKVRIIYNSNNRDVEWMASLAEPQRLHLLPHECEWYDLTRVSDMYTDIGIITLVNDLMTSPESAWT